MIKANELRFGNWIKGLRGNAFQVKAADIFTIEMGHDNGLCEPIELTADVLEACGFENDRENETFQLDTDFGFCIYGSIALGVAVNIDYKIVGNAVTHLHQLQNLYHALTGEELNYTPAGIA